MLGPNFRPPPSPPAQVYTSSPMVAKTAGIKTPGGESQHLDLGKEIPSEWWKLFHSEPLNALIIAGLNNSPNVKAAEAALRGAQENLKAEIGLLYFPQISGMFEAQRERFSGALFGLPTTTGADIFNLYNISVNVSYNLDVFGGLHRQVEGFAALVDYQAFELEAAYLTLTANIVTTAISEASLREQIAATLSLISLQEKILQITENQFRLGGVSQSEVLAQKTQLAQTKATLPPLEKNLAQTRHALSVLVGWLPSDNHLPVFTLQSLHLPASLPVSLPSNLVRQRPDVRASEALLHQASANIGVATANLFPTFPLTANYGYEANKLNQLFRSTTNIWDIAFQVTQPIFQGGALLARRRQAIAAYEQAAAQYRQTVLQAFQNVADVLQALEDDARAYKAQYQAESDAWQTFVLVQKQYRLGAVNYIALLDAERQYQSAKINRIQVQSLRFADTAALFQALGGGWWNRPRVVFARTSV